MGLYYFIFGFIRIYVFPESAAAAVTALLRRGLSANMDKNGNITIPYFKRKRYENALKKTSYEVVGAGGLPVILMNNKRRIGIFSALALVILFYSISSLFIWDIRIEGNEKVPDSVILHELSEIGFSVGERWGSITLSEAEWAVLDVSDNVGWININRRGNVAYVTVKEKTVYPDKNSEKAFSNVVASRDCIIEEITVKSGVAVVKAGDTVKAGDLLISGILPEEAGGGFVAADGIILGRVHSEISVEVPRKESNTEFGEEKLKSATLKIFNFNINIFKRYGKTDNSCAIIDDRKEYTLLARCRLPISLERIYTVEKRSVEKTYTDAELARVAASRLTSLRAMVLRDAELMRIKTFGEYTEDGYRMTSLVSVLTEVGEKREISGTK